MESRLGQGNAFSVPVGSFPSPLSVPCDGGLGRLRRLIYEAEINYLLGLQGAVER